LLLLDLLTSENNKLAAKLLRAKLIILRPGQLATKYGTTEAAEPTAADAGGTAWAGDAALSYTDFRAAQRIVRGAAGRIFAVAVFF
jgi:hypothetical protein